MRQRRRPLLRSWMFPPWRDVARIGASHCRPRRSWEHIARQFLAQAEGGIRGGWVEHGKATTKSGNQPSRIAFAHPSGHVQSASFTTALHPKIRSAQRPLGITVREDQLVQCAAVEVLDAICEKDFLEFWYGFRPARGQHDALDALATGITRTSVGCWRGYTGTKSSFTIPRAAQSRRSAIRCGLESRPAW